MADNCGGCGVVCPFIGAGASCVNGVCRLFCPPGTGDCNLDPTDGCETNTSSSITNCGSCGTSCSTLGYAISECIGGRCQGVCAPGFLDCDGFVTVALLFDRHTLTHTICNRSITAILRTAVRRQYQATRQIVELVICSARTQMLQLQYVEREYAAQRVIQVMHIALER